MISKLKEFSKILKEVHLVNLIASRDLFLESDWLRRVQLFSELYPKTGAIKTLLHSSILNQSTFDYYRAVYKNVLLTKKNALKKNRMRISTKEEKRKRKQKAKRKHYGTVLCGRKK